ncbi:hypothetical protein [Evtepia gabavorous]|uniref:hypothetical protein n=1 Tax=Evtepia gabavorous TaxID=2211183 RepID=UPI00399B1A5E
MNPVQEIKQRHDMDILLRAIAPAARKRQEARSRREVGKSRINAALPAGAFPSVWYEGLDVSSLPPVQAAVERVRPGTWREGIYLPQVRKGVGIS